MNALVTDLENVAQRAAAEAKALEADLEVARQEASQAAVVASNIKQLLNK